MLDERTFALLDIINFECGSGGYKVFFIKDLISSFPKHLLIDEEQILECIEVLANHQYISVKYQDQNEICLSSLVKGRLESENRLDEKIQALEINKRHFLFSFLGAILGGFCAFLLALIFKLLGGI